MVVLGKVETLQRHYFSDDPRWTDLRSVELRDIGIRNSLLIIIDVKDGGSVRGTHVWALAVEFLGSWVTENEDAQQLAVSDFGRIVNHFDGLRMSSRFWMSAGRPHTPVADFKRIRYYVARSGVAY